MTIYGKGAIIHVGLIYILHRYNLLSVDIKFHISKKNYMYQIFPFFLFVSNETSIDNE